MPLAPLPSPEDFRAAHPGAVDLVERLQNEGHTAYLAGGCVRDLLLGKPFKDIDIASDASPDRVETLFDHTHAIGKSFGVIQVVLGDDTFEVAAFRQDRAYHDGRRPEGYDPTTPEEDAQRRDFTINGLFLNPLTMEVLDYVGGVSDLERKRLRTIGDPDERFLEDHLRLLRAIRFTVVLGFEPDSAMLTSIRTHAHLLGTISVERQFTEFSRILTEAPRIGDAIETLADAGLLQILLPDFMELKGCTQPPEYHPEGDVWTHTLLMLNDLNQPSLPLALAVLLHDIGKPATRTVDDDGRIRFTGHAQVGAEMADRWLRNMKASNAVRNQVKGIVDRHMNFMNVPQMRPASRRRMVAHPDFPLELDLHRLDCRHSNGITATAEQLALDFKAYQAAAALPDPWITGQDLLELGLTPGPEIGIWKQRAYDEQLEGQFADKEALRCWLVDRLRTD